MNIENVNALSKRKFIIERNENEVSIKYIFLVQKIELFKN